MPTPIPRVAAIQYLGQASFAPANQGSQQYPIDVCNVLNVLSMPVQRTSAAPPILWTGWLNSKRTKPSPFSVNRERSSQGEACALKERSSPCTALRVFSVSVGRTATGRAPTSSHARSFCGFFKFFEVLYLFIGRYSPRMAWVCGVLLRLFPVLLRLFPGVIHRVISTNCVNLRSIASPLCVDAYYLLRQVKWMA